MSPRTKTKTQVPPVRPLPALNDRELRFQKEWRTIALLADQAAEVKARYPQAVTADVYQRQFQEALNGLLKLVAEYWGASSLRDTADAYADAMAAEREWFARNGLVS